MIHYITPYATDGKKKQVKIFNKKYQQNKFGWGV